jgi:hypothetical protein
VRIEGASDPADPDRELFESGGDGIRCQSHVFPQGL